MERFGCRFLFIDVEAPVLGFALAELEDALSLSLPHWGILTRSEFCQRVFNDEAVMCLAEALVGTSAAVSSGRWVRDRHEGLAATQLPAELIQGLAVVPDAALDDAAESLAARWRGHRSWFAGVEEFCLPFTRAVVGVARSAVAIDSAVVMWVMGGGCE